MSGEILVAIEQKMLRALDAMERDFHRINVGGSSGSLVDEIFVTHGGVRTPLLHVAGVTVQNPRTLVITPWDPGALRAIGTAISQSRLGLTPTIDGSTIYIYVPAMTAQRRDELIGLVRTRSEGTRVDVRSLRHEGIATIRAPERHVGADELRRELTLLDRLTARMIGEIDRRAGLKEQAIRRVW